MNLRRPLLTASAVLTLALGAQAIAQKSSYYKYVNKQGINVVSSRIPSEYVKKGYAIVTFDGRVIEMIPPELSPAEKAYLVTETERVETLKQRDTILLRRYSRPDDIEAAKQRKVSQILNAVGLMNLNIEKINSQINLYQSLAAEDERAGEKISTDTIEAMQRLKSDRDIAIKQREQKTDDVKRIIEEHNKDISRFKKIIRANPQ
jgi:hypothetical protein